MRSTFTYCIIRGDSTIRSLYIHLLESKNISVRSLERETGIAKAVLLNYKNFSYKEGKLLKKPMPSQMDIKGLMSYLGYNITLKIEPK